MLCRQSTWEFPISVFNKMHAHDTKTSSMVVGTRQREDGTHHFDIKANDVSINQVFNQKPLTKTGSTHIEHLCKTVSSKISLLHQLTEYEYVPIHVHKQFNQSNILLLIGYGVIFCKSRQTIKTPKTRSA